MINEILDFIAKYTYHVLDEYGRPAKIPIGLIKRKFETKFPNWQTVMKVLINKKWITSFNWGELIHDQSTLRITSKGRESSKLDILFERKDIKRILLWDDRGNPHLADYKDWTELAFFYDKEGNIIYDDELALTKLKLGMKGNIE